MKYEFGISGMDNYFYVVKDIPVGYFQLLGAQITLRSPVQVKTQRFASGTVRLADA
jgi:hypothetical protein